MKWLVLKAEKLPLLEFKDSWNGRNCQSLMGRRSRSWNQTYQGQAGETHPNSEKGKRNFSGCSSSTKLECTEKMEPDFWGTQSNGHKWQYGHSLEIRGALFSPEGSQEDQPSEAIVSPALEIFPTQLDKARSSLIQKACLKQGLD